MKKHRLILKPWFIVGCLLIIPTTLFTGIQLLTLNDQEEAIESIYTKQLESVLFSINQYTDDISNNWINKLYKELEPASYENTYEKDLPAFPQVQMFIMHPLADDTLNLNHFHIANDSLQNEIITQLRKYESEISQLKEYLKSGYRKIIGIDLEYQQHLSMLTFVSRNNDRFFLNILLVDAQKFISEALSPRLQMVAGENLIIVVRHAKTNQLIASSLLNEAPEDVIKEQAIWLLPDYKLGILPRGISIADLARKRAAQNIALLILVDVLLIIGAWLFYRNVKRELHLAKVKSDFVSNVSHEIRTPLALISMYAETLQMGRLKGEDKRQRYYDIIYGETQRLSGIVNNILNFSRIESGRQKLHFVPLSLNAVVAEVLRNYRHHLKEKGFTLKLQQNEQLTPIMADRQAMSECLINLIDNAIKYSKDKKTLAITTGLKNQYQFVEIKDEGLGIAPNEQKHIFQKFYRVTKGALAHHAKGSGLGLSIVMHLMKEHKGKIELESEEGHGSCFRLLFPIHKPNNLS
ncbi:MULTISPECIES: sensor histidine kinase [unclassified Carboxylicivirga]|uniref:sensor histidine kinase n=1 Tax=Carboxylicivirga TaxID=1628153 RepID=UPI003D34BB81